MHSQIISIAALTQKGQGEGTLTYPDNRVRTVDVPYTLPGEIVVADLHRGIGHLTEVKKASEDRVNPRCLHFGTCGGCSLQHMDYRAELQWKEQRVYSLFEKYTEATFHPIQASPQEYGYRNKMEFTFSDTKAGEKFLGLMLANGRGKVFNLTECHLIDPWVAELVIAVRTWWESTHLKAYFHGKNSGTLRTLTTRFGMTSKDRMVILTVSGNPEYAIKQQELDSFVEAIKGAMGSHKVSIILRIHQAIKGQPTQFYEMVLQGPDYIRETITIGDKDLEFRISPHAFFQPNTRTATYIYNRAQELIGLSKDLVIYDFYCGIGTFGMTFAHLAKEVIGIELSKDAAYDAKVNAERLGIDNFTIYSGDVATILRENKGKFLTPDVVIVDPPRAGLEPKALQELLTLLPKIIIYVSCNPYTQAPNIDELVQQGYRVRDIQPVDQFPHTAHVENIIVLHR